VIEKHLMKLRARDEIGTEEEAAIRAAVAEVVDYAADYTFIHRGQELNHSTILLDGLACRYKDLSDGARQISELHIAGDFADLHSFTLKYLDHDMMTLTPCRAALFPHERLRDITERFPHLTRVYWFATNLDAAIHREWELSLGRRSALSRTAHLFCELHVRLAIVGLAGDAGYDLALTQIDIAECLGLTSVHVNRMLRELREMGLMEFSRGRVTLMNLEALRDVAEFDPTYLYLDPRRR
jgi:CRP-like cAMP-binding protein